MEVLGNDWQTFLVTEFDFFSLPLPTVLLYVAIALICRFLVHGDKLRLLKSEYRASPEYGLDDENTLNVMYRMVAPAVISYMLLFLAFVFSSLIGFTWTPSVRWLPVAIYWLIYLPITMTCNNGIYPVWVVISQATVSLVAAIYFDWAVLYRIPEAGILAFDQSNIGWQVLVGAFAVASALILIGLQRHVSRYNNWSRHSYTQSVAGHSAPSAKRIEIEKKLFSYERKYGELLSDRCKQDYALRAFFLLVMLMEDTNRPGWFRMLERLFFRTGRIKSTGIMQIRADAPLTDKESVQRAAPIIEDIWDGFLSAHAAMDNAETVIFSDSWYSYDYTKLSDIMRRNSSELYGRYCGTYLLDVSYSARLVFAFVQTYHNLREGQSIMVPSDLFASAAHLLPNRRLCYLNGRVSMVSDDVPYSAVEIKAICRFKPSRKEIAGVIGDFENNGCVVQYVDYVPEGWCQLGIVPLSDGPVIAREDWYVIPVAN